MHRLLPVLAGGALLVGAGFWLGGRSRGPGDSVPAASAAIGANPQPEENRDQTEAAPATAAVLPAADPVATTPSGPPPEIPSTVGGLNELADGKRSLGEKISILAEVMRRPDPKMAAAAAARAVAIVGNSQHASHLRALLTDAGIRPEAMEVLTLNLYSRPMDVMLPAWAAILESPGHSKAVEAAETLEFYLKEKSAGRGEALQKAVRQYLNGEPAR